MQELLKILRAGTISCPQCNAEWIAISRRPFAFAYACGAEHEHLDGKRWRILAHCPRSKLEEIEL